MFSEEFLNNLGSPKFGYSSMAEQKQSPSFSGRILNLLKSIGRFGKESLLQPAARTAMQLSRETNPALMAMKPKEDIIFTPKSEVGKFFFGEKPVKTLEERLRYNIEHVGELPGVTKGSIGAGILGAGATVLGTVADLPTGADDAFLSIAKTTGVNKIYRILEKSFNITDAGLAKKLVKVKDVKQVKKIIANYKPQELLTEQTVKRMGEAPTFGQKLITILNKSEKLSAEKRLGYKIQRETQAAKMEKIFANPNLTPEQKMILSKRATMGELAKPELESITDKFTSEELTGGLKEITDNNFLSVWDKKTAIRGWEKLFDPNSTSVPNPSEIKVLEKIWGKDFSKAMSGIELTKWKKIKNSVIDVANFPRTAIASFDASAPFRQGLVAGFISPKRFAQSFKEMFKYAGNKKAFEYLYDDISQKSTHDLMEKFGLEITEYGETKALIRAEESFLSNIAEKIPIYGKGVQASERMYVGFLNKLRADVFDDLAQKFMKQGYDPDLSPKVFEDLAKLVNTATGRGSLGVLEPIATELTTTFFSPRLIASRLQMLNPLFYARLSKPVRREALKGAIGMVGTGLTILGLASAAGADVEADPRSSDFGKIKIGETRIDIWGGHQQYIRALAQLVTGQTKNITTKEVTNLGEKYGGATRTTVISRLARSKLSPVVADLVDAFEGKDITGRKFSLGRSAYEAITPLVVQDLIDTYQYEKPENIPAALLGIFGVGIQTYEPKKIAFQRKAEEKIRNIKAVYGKQGWTEQQIGNFSDDFLAALRGK